MPATWIIAPQKQKRSSRLRLDLSRSSADRGPPDYSGSVGPGAELGTRLHVVVEHELDKREVHLVPAHGAPGHLDLRRRVDLVLQRVVVERLRADDRTRRELHRLLEEIEQLPVELVTRDVEQRFLVPVRE